MQKIVKWLEASNFTPFEGDSDWGTIVTSGGVSLIQRDTLEQPLKDCEQILEIEEGEVIVRSAGLVGIYDYYRHEFPLPLAQRVLPETQAEANKVCAQGFVVYQEGDKFGLYKVGAGVPVLSGFDSIERLTDEVSNDMGFRVKRGQLVGEYQLDAPEELVWSLPVQFHDYKWYPESLFARVTLKGKFGVWNGDRQKLVIPTEFDSIDMIDEFEGTFTVTKGNMVGLYDTTKGEVFWK